MTPEEQTHNQLLSHDRIIVENFYCRMKSIFGIVYGEYRGDLELLVDVIPILICLTNFHIHKNPLRKKTSRNDQTNSSSSSSELSDSLNDENDGIGFNLNIVE